LNSYEMMIKIEYQIELQNMRMNKQLKSIYKDHL
jgi:hypothetical protein